MKNYLKRSTNFQIIFELSYVLHQPVCSLILSRDLHLPACLASPVTTHDSHKLCVCLLPLLIIYDWLETASWEGKDNMVYVGVKIGYDGINVENFPGNFLFEKER